MDIMYTGPSPALTGLLGEDEIKNLEKRALTTGLINAAVGALVGPKGDTARSIGIAALAGQYGMQKTYDNALDGYLQQQKIAEMKRAQGVQQAQDQFRQNFGQYGSPQEMLKAGVQSGAITPEKYLELATKQGESAFAKIDPSKFTPESIAVFNQTGDYSRLDPIDKAPGESTLEKEYRFMVNNGFKGTPEQYIQMKKEMNPYQAAQLNIALANLGIAQNRASYETGYNPGSAAPAPQAKHTVTAPDGNVYAFPSKEAAAAFKKSIGGK